MQKSFFPFPGCKSRDHSETTEPEWPENIQYYRNKPIYETTQEFGQFSTKKIIAFSTKRNL